MPTVHTGKPGKAAGLFGASVAVSGDAVGLFGATVVMSSSSGAMVGASSKGFVSVQHVSPTSPRSEAQTLAGKLLNGTIEWIYCCFHIIACRFAEARHIDSRHIKRIVRRRSTNEKEITTGTKDTTKEM